MWHFGVPISEQDIVKPSEAIGDNNYDRVKEHLLHKDELHSMDLFMLEKREAQGECSRALKSWPVWRKWKGTTVTVSSDIKTRRASGCKGKERVIFITKLLSSGVLCQGTVWIVNFYTGLKTIRKTWKKNLLSIMKHKGIALCLGRPWTARGWEVTGAGIALLSDSFCQSFCC